MHGLIHYEAHTARNEELHRRAAERRRNRGAGRFEPRSRRFRLVARSPQRTVPAARSAARA